MRYRELLTRVASAYYEREKTQQEIADTLQVSRSSISRMLKEARQQGIVRIQVVPSPLTARVNWRQSSRAGRVSLHVLIPWHPSTEALLPLVSQFEEMSNLRVHCQVLPEDEYWSKVNADLQSGGGLVDVLMVSPYDFSQNMAQGRFELLAGYLQDSDLTDAEWYAAEDFYPALLDIYKWPPPCDPVRAQAAGQLFTGLAAIPMTYEVMQLSYRVDLLEQAGISPDDGWPHSWDELYDAARRTTIVTNGEPPVPQFGLLSRANPQWNAMYGGYANIFYSYGGRDFGDDLLHPLVNSPQGVAATELWIEMIRRCAPPDGRT